MERILPAYKEADLFVFASMFYYFTMTAQMEVVNQRAYLIGKSTKEKPVQLLIGREEWFSRTKYSPIKGL